MEAKIIFINPQAQHSFFSLHALSKCGHVEYLCPPLSLQLALGHWLDGKLDAHHSVISLLFFQPASVLFFILFKKNVIPEALYVQAFNVLAYLFLMGRPRSTVYIYQDYMLPLVRRYAGKHRFVCEFIIQISQGEPNYESSIKAAALVDDVVAATKLIIDQLSGHEHSPTLAPFGGDKINYRATKKQQQRMVSLHERKFEGSILIAARANSYRKGFDLLIEAIQQLDLNWPIDVQHTLRIQICGDVADGDLSRQLQALQKKLEGRGCISLHAGQLSMDAYQELLNRADLFVMPSRLEGSSLAALEALWTGVPALLSEACGIDQFSSGRHGQLLHPNTAECLAEALMAVLMNPSQLVSWRKALQNDQPLFTWSNYLRILPEIIARQ